MRSSFLSGVLQRVPVCESCKGGTFVGSSARVRARISPRARETAWDDLVSKSKQSSTNERRLPTLDRVQFTGPNLILMMCDGENGGYTIPART